MAGSPLAMTTHLHIEPASTGPHRHGDSSMNRIDRAQATIDQDLPLKEDIRLLGRLLGDTLREQEGEETFDLIEQHPADGHPFSS